MQVERLFVSADHNYFGHHGGPAGEHSTMEVSEIDCVAGRGIRHDRFFDYSPDYKGQITFFAIETFFALCTSLGIEDASPAALRRNVLTRGLDLPSLIGAVFEVQGVRFLGTEECRPCYWMDRALGSGAEAWLRGRGGLRARILSDGNLRLTDASVISYATLTGSVQ